VDLCDYFLELHDHTHYQGKARRLLDEPTPEQYRAVLPHHNSIAWCLWHIARGEDWTIQTILQEREQLLTRVGWAARLGVDEPGFGGGMSRADMIALSERIDLDGLRGYYDAVADATRDFVRRCNFDKLDEPFDIDSRLALLPDAAGPSASMHQMLARWKTPHVWLDVMVVVDVAFHIEEAEHVLRLLLPDREFP
jgi:hypothetical protein